MPQHQIRSKLLDVGLRLAFGGFGLPALGAVEIIQITPPDNAIKPVKTTNPTMTTTTNIETLREDFAAGAGAEEAPLVGCAGLKVGCISAGG